MSLTICKSCQKFRDPLLFERLLIGYISKCKDQLSITIAVILLPAHPASFAHKFLFQRVPGCNSMADLSLKIVFWTH